MNSARPLRRRASLELTFFFSSALSASSFSFYGSRTRSATHLLAVHAIFLPLREGLGSDGRQTGVGQLRALDFTHHARAYESLDVLQTHEVLVLGALLLAESGLRLALGAALVDVAFGKSVSVLATRDHALSRRRLGSVGALPEPAVALLLDGVQEVLADDLGLRLRALAFLLAQHLLQLVTVPVRVRFLGLCVTTICVNILLGGTTRVQSQVVAVLASRALVATTRLEEGAKNRLGILTEGELQFTERSDDEPSER